jgi:predicted dehydrogenase
MRPPARVIGGGKVMVRFGLLGCASGHAVPFARLLNRRYDHLRVAGDACAAAVWSADRARAEEVAAQGAVPLVARDIREVVAEVDAVLVVDDTGDGASHRELALPAIDAGLPTFVDKPMTPTLAGALELFELADSRGVPITSSSALRYAPQLDGLRARLAEIGDIRALTVVGPGEWWFYGVHLAEIAVALLGTGFSDVYRTEIGGVTTSAVARHDSGTVVTLSVVKDARDGFHVAVEGTLGHADAFLADYVPMYAGQLAGVVDMVRSGRPPVPRAETVEVLAVLDAGVRSAQGGRAAPVRKDEAAR